MKPAALHPVIGLRTIFGILVVSALALAPACAFAQRGGGGRAGGGAAHAGGAARPGGGVRAPAPVRAPVAGVSRPTAVNPGIARPIMPRPGGVSPVAPFRTPLGPSRVFFPTRPPLRLPIRPIGPFLGTTGVFGFGFNPFFFPGCNAFWGFASGCGIASPFFGIGYSPVIVYPPYPAYPVGPAYPDQTYPPADSSTSFQYTPQLNQYPPAQGLTGEDLNAPGRVGAQLRNDVLLYLEDGSVFAVASYTVSNGQLHYATAYGEQNDLAVDLLDLQKTIEANAARGVTFTLTPSSSAPGSSAPAPLGPAPAPEGPITPGKR